MQVNFDSMSTLNALKIINNLSDWTKHLISAQRHSCYSVHLSQPILFHQSIARPWLISFLSHSLSKKGGGKINNCN